ncbi:MAG: carboxy terminal-processing peptidase [Bacteroidales bacterium]|jgi:carboxyl-terminal processing protease|nr:carboxy terminal-processing peptidase [Bacteroidales bacterium]
MKKIIRTSLIVTILCITIGTLFALTRSGESEDKDTILLAYLTEILKEFHYSPLKYDDEFSEKVYDGYLKSLDYSKMFLTKENIAVLESYKTKIDDQILNSQLDFFHLSVEIIDAQTAVVETLYPIILEKPFDYTIDEQFVMDEKQRGYAANNQELEAQWWKYLKMQVLDEIVIAENENKKAHEKSDTVVLKSFDEIEKGARATILRRYNTRFKRMNQTTEADRFNSFVNAITGAFDPHTNYFPPKEKQQFDISISGRLEGIGATLSERDGYIKVVEVMPGSPAWKSGELKAEDIILKVAQAGEEPVDVVDMRLDDAIQLIRGKKGTKVILTVKKIDGSIIEIPIVRDVIVLEEKYAKSTIINTSDNAATQVGYIYLPQFYTDMNDIAGRRAADDIKIEVQKLKEQNVAGIIIDLRDNGGGSLQDVVDIGGYFIEKGPIVQVSSSGGNRRALFDRDPSILYSGPLLIIVNTFSASASEILAAAMQDYKRAVIVGTQSTYGKGTVQRVIDIDQLVSNSQHKAYMPFGAIKITIQKFYRINGSSTQLKGVIPDIVLPDLYQKIEIGERELDNAMPWTVTQPEKYTEWKPQSDVKKLAKKSEQRVKNDSVFNAINSASVWLADRRNERVVSLQIDQFRARQAKNTELAERYKNVGQHETPLRITEREIVAKTADAAVDSLNQKRRDEWYADIKKDVELYETYRIMLDMIQQFSAMKK